MTDSGSPLPRQNYDHRPGVITIIGAKDALDGSSRLIGEISAGPEVRELTVEVNGNTLLAANFSSDQLEAVDLRNVGRAR